MLSKDQPAPQTKEERDRMLAQEQRRYEQSLVSGAAPVPKPPTPAQADTLDAYAKADSYTRPKRSR